MSTALLVLLIVLTASSAEAQSTAPDPIVHRVTISQSLNDKSTVNEPAVFSVALPDSGDATNVIAAAMTMSLQADTTNPKFKLGVSAQFNQNTAPTSRQNALFAGASMHLRTGPAGADAGEMPFHFLRGSVFTGYKRNGITHAEGVATNAYMTFEENRPDVTSTGIRVGAYLDFTPQVGIEVDDVKRSPHPDGTGRRVRTLYATQINLLPFGPNEKRLIASANMAWRYDVQTDFPNTDRDHRFAQLSLALTLDEHGVFRFGVDRLIGDDPTQGFVGPDVTRLSFRIQLNITQKKSFDRKRRNSVATKLV